MLLIFFNFFNLLSFVLLFKHFLILNTTRNLLFMPIIMDPRNQNRNLLAPKEIMLLPIIDLPVLTDPVVLEEAIIRAKILRFLNFCFLTQFLVIMLKRLNTICLRIICHRLSALIAVFLLVNKPFATDSSRCKFAIFYAFRSTFNNITAETSFPFERSIVRNTLVLTIWLGKLIDWIQASYWSHHIRCYWSHTTSL